MQCAGWSFLFFTLRRQPEQQRCELRGVLLELQQLLGQHELEHRRAQFCNKMIFQRIAFRAAAKIQQHHWAGRRTNVQSLQKGL